MRKRVNIQSQVSGDRSLSVHGYRIFLSAAAGNLKNKDIYISGSRTSR
ncbi:hypothetical protein [Maribellus sp. YY47]|nr:hypothetical protein [Maribellus sp. YY47]MCK3685107.1 hypothetical protein [Maribellus sp. YY47]